MLNGRKIFHVCNLNYYTIACVVVSFTLAKPSEKLVFLALNGLCGERKPLHVHCSSIHGFRLIEMVLLLFFLEKKPKLLSHSQLIHFAAAIIHSDNNSWKIDQLRATNVFGSNSWKIIQLINIHSFPHKTNISHGMHIWKTQLSHIHMHTNTQCL